MLSYMLASYADRRLQADGMPARATCRNAVLVAFSLIFYAWGEPVYVFLMLLSVLANYWAGLAIDRGQGRNRAALVAGLAVNVLILGVF